MTLHVQHISIATGSSDTESRLVFADDHLVAVLVRLSDDHGEDAGKWFLEAGFGPVDDRAPPKFVGLDEAQGWIARKLDGR